MLEIDAIEQADPVACQLGRAVWFAETGQRDTAYQEAWRAAVVAQDWTKARRLLGVAYRDYHDRNRDR